MDKIIPAFRRTLLNPDLGGACAEIAELGIDALLDEGVLRSLPLVDLLIGVGKTAQNIHDRNLMRQTARFIAVFNEKELSPEKREKYKARLLQDGKFAQEELGRVLILLNATVDLKKSALLAKLYRAYVEGTVDWDTFCELADVVARIFLSDVRLLRAVHKGEVTDTSQCQNYQVDRLIALGLLRSSMKSLTIGGMDDDHTQRHIRVSQWGRLFCALSE